MLSQALFLTTVLLAVALYRTLRGEGGVSRYFGLVLGGELLLSFAAQEKESSFLALVAIGLAVLSVVLPSLFQLASRAAFSRGRLTWGVRLAGIRTLLMPASGLASQLEILEGMVHLEKEGADAALSYFRRLLPEAQERGDVLVIDEQIVAMLFWSQRWAEGIAYYQRRFPHNYAALRPSMLLSLLRAYGEMGQLERAASMLQSFEKISGSSSSEPLLQARLTFLAYGGAVSAVDHAAQSPSSSALGISPAHWAFLQGVARLRSGDRKGAGLSFAKVEKLAKARDHKVLEAAGIKLKAMTEPMDDAKESASAGEKSQGEEKTVEVLSYLALVTARLQALLEQMPLRHAGGRMTAFFAALLVLSAGWSLFIGHGAYSVIELGALSPELLVEGGWPRILTAPWVHGPDLFALIFLLYSLWLSGQIVERVLGSLRMAFIALFSAYTGALWGCMAGLGPQLFAETGIIGASILPFGLLTSGMILLLTKRIPQLTGRQRRNLIAILLFLWLLNAFASVPLGIPMSGVLIACVVAVLLTVLMPRREHSFLSSALKIILLSLAGGTMLAFMWVARERRDPSSLVLSQVCSQGHLAFDAASTFRASDDDLSKWGFGTGFFDALAQRSGARVRILLIEGVVEGESAIFAAIPDLKDSASVTIDKQLPTSYADVASGNDLKWQSLRIWQNGELSGRAIEGRLEAVGGQVGSIILWIEPEFAMEDASALWGEMLKSVHRREGAADEGPECVLKRGQG